MSSMNSSSRGRASAAVGKYYQIEARTRIAPAVCVRPTGHGAQKFAKTPRTKRERSSSKAGSRRTRVSPICRDHVMASASNARANEGQGAYTEVNTKRQGCPFCTMPRILSLAIEKGAFVDSTPAPIPTPKSAKRISMATLVLRMPTSGATSN